MDLVGRHRLADADRVRRRAAHPRVVAPGVRALADHARGRPGLTLEGGRERDRSSGAACSAASGSRTCRARRARARARRARRRPSRRADASERAGRPSRRSRLRPIRAWRWAPRPRSATPVVSSTLTHVGAEVPPQATMGSFAEEMQVELAEGGQEAIRDRRAPRRDRRRNGSAGDSGTGR